MFHFNSQFKPRMQYKYNRVPLKNTVANLNANLPAEFPSDMT